MMLNLLLVQKTCQGLSFKWSQLASGASGNKQTVLPEASELYALDAKYDWPFFGVYSDAS